MTGSPHRRLPFPPPPHSIRRYCPSALLSLSASVSPVSAAFAATTPSQRLAARHRQRSSPSPPSPPVQTGATAHTVTAEAVAATFLQRRRDLADGVAASPSSLAAAGTGERNRGRRGALGVLKDVPKDKAALAGALTATLPPVTLATLLMEEATTAAAASPFPSVRSSHGGGSRDTSWSPPNESPLDSTSPSPRASLNATTRTASPPRAPPLLCPSPTLPAAPTVVVPSLQTASASPTRRASPPLLAQYRPTPLLPVQLVAAGGGAAVIAPLGHAHASPALTHAAPTPVAPLSPSRRQTSPQLPTKGTPVLASVEVNVRERDARCLCAAWRSAAHTARAALSVDGRRGKASVATGHARAISQAAPSS